MFDFGRNRVVGVDIGSFAVKLLQLRKTRSGWAVRAAGIGNIAQTDEDGSGPREANALRGIIDCLQLSGNTTNLAVCGVSGPEVTVRRFEFASVAPDEIERAVIMEARQVRPFNTDDIVVDYRWTSENDAKTIGYLVAATNRLVRNKVQLVRKAGLNCALVDMDGLALLNCFNELDGSEPGGGVALLNVGSSLATLVIKGANGLPFVRDLTYGGDAIVRQIAAESDTSVDALRKALFSHDTDVPQFGSSLQKACDRLIVDIAKTLRYYQTLERSYDVRKIFVCGGFALVDGFVELLNRQLHVEAVLWNPFEIMGCDVERGHRGVLQRNILEKNGPAMAVAAGLAMRSV